MFREDAADEPGTDDSPEDDVSEGELFQVQTLATVLSDVICAHKTPVQRRFQEASMDPEIGESDPVRGAFFIKIPLGMRGLSTVDVAETKRISKRSSWQIEEEL